MKLIMGVLGLGFVLFACQQSSTKIVPADYQKWASPTDTILNYQIPGHGNRLREIHMNDQALKAVIKDGRASFAEGSIVAKDIYEHSEKQEGEMPINATVMVKAPNDPRSRGGWLWILRDYKTGIETIIEGEFCFTCHADANGTHPYGDTNPNNEFRDYVYYFPTAGKTTATSSEYDQTSTSPTPTATTNSSQPSYGYKY